ncbi:MAG: zinc metallopeptidase [Ruminococcaceae bacterium]|nr:zinc metallopeptidase [Oscillospiraceae bacterium]
MYFDWTYLVLVLPAILLATWASSNVRSTFKKYSAIRSRRGITGAQAARRVLDANGLQNVRIERVSGNLTDHYDPKTNVIRLSDSVYDNPSTAAIGVACHEAGHAVQYAVDYAPVKLRAAIIPATNIGSKLAMPLILLGLLFIHTDWYVLAYAGIICFSLSTVFQLLTLPTEFNASRRAMEAIESSGLLYKDELPAAKKTLRAAAMTYVAALAVSAAQLLRLILNIGGIRRRD